MVIFKKYIYWILVLMVGAPIHGQEATITQDEFLKQLQKTHPLFEKEKLTPQITKEAQNAFLGAEDWRLMTSVNYLHEEPMIAIAGPEKTDAVSATGGIERVFWATGGRFSTSFTSSWAKIKLDPIFGFPETFYQNQLSVSYMHPLLKNKKGFLDRLQYDLKQFDIDFSEIQAKENMENFLAGSAGKFLDWVFLTEQEKIFIGRLELSIEELERTKRKRSANLVDQADVIRAEDAVNTWRQNQFLALSQWKALQAELAVLSQNNELYHTTPDFDLYGIIPLPEIEDAVMELKKNSRLLNVIDIRLDQLQVVRSGYEETAKPDLWLNMQANIKKFDEEMAKALGMDKPDALIGLQYRFPIQNRTARHQTIKTDLQTTQLEKQRDEVVLALTSVLTGLHIQIQELVNVMKLNQEQIESAKERTIEELKLYNQGRGDLTFVIMSRDNEENAKLTYAINALTYHKLVVAYQAMMDQFYH